MHPTLARKYQQLEAEKSKLLGIVSKCSPLQQRFRPSEYEWSMLEVIEHLATSEASINQVFKKYPPHRAEKRLTWKNHWNTFLLQIALKTPLKFPAPAKLKPPQGNTSFKEWEAFWAKERALFKEMLEEFPAEKMGYFTFKHPRSGPMNMKNTIVFMKNHVQHHIYQINRIRKHQQFPTK